MDGHNVRLFASRHLQDISGIVLIDPSVENQVPILERAAPAIAENDKNSMGFIRYCANPDRSAEAAARCARQAPATYPSDLAAAYVESYGLPYFQTFLSEVESFLTVDSQQGGAERRASVCNAVRRPHARRALEQPAGRSGSRRVETVESNARRPCEALDGRIEPRGQRRQPLHPRRQTRCRRGRRQRSRGKCATATKKGKNSNPNGYARNWKQVRRPSCLMSQPCLTTTGCLGV